MQLGTGTNFNVTLNLSGLILLGLGLSTALLAYMFLDAFKDDGKDSYSYGYDSYGYDTSGSGGYGHKRGDFNRKTSRGKVKMILGYLNFLLCLILYRVIATMRAVKKVLKRIDILESISLSRTIFLYLQ